MISSIDHLVLTVRSIEDTVAFYERALGMKKEIFGAGRVALKFGNQKFNLHEMGKEIEPKAHSATSGSADICLITNQAIGEAYRHVESMGVEIIQGVVERTGACGVIQSFYIRDPDKNLIEVSSYAAAI